ncbi:phage EaA protein [Klebsiella pneumoniae]|nr:phage EaA protein [Klebsiella pneumoniae]SXB44085.1 phage EaA protein [Klebsiella pneumoniae]SXB76592.1 phage EaA protein [Klebsiella pneumoniae]VGC35237.1 phage EaA protein [Klebsiella pneumoniae]
MTDITELALIKGQKVEAPYYLAECTECGKMYSSSKLIVSRNYFDGDADCYCPHCNADDADIADLGSGEQPAVMAWNYQQARIDVLVEALEKAQQRNAELEAQNEYIRKRYQQLDLLIGKNILVMQAAIIEWQATGDAKNGLAWIYNTLFGPGELPDEAEKDAQAYFDRKYAPLDEELMALHKWFWEQSEAERAAAGIKVEVK